MSRFLLSLLVVGLSFPGCSWRRPQRDVVSRVEPVHNNIILMEPELARFSGAGPFRVDERLDREVSINLDQSVVVDHFYAASADKLPIVIISHGNFSSKRAHRAQARDLASWGFHVLTFEAPNREQWIENGNRLLRFTELLNRMPSILGANADGSRMIIVGHSFGGSASILAIASGAPVMGAILLDPAVVHSSVIGAMRKIDLPVALLGADRGVFTARGRAHFAKSLGGGLLEVSVANATHDDAQGPSMFSKSALGVDPFTSVQKQRVFKSLLTVAALGLSSSGTLDFPARIFSREAKVAGLKNFQYREGK